MAKAEVIAQWKRDEQAPFSGWDFSYIADRHSPAAPDWNYSALARAQVENCRAVLDIGTGGGEVFASLAPFPGRAVAIESYAPNVAVAARRLMPLGVKVLEADSTGPLPFVDASFDLVLNRHEAFGLAEVARLLCAGGTFLTQQVAGDDWTDLMACFGVGHKWPEHTLSKTALETEAAGLKVVRAEEWRGETRFADVGAIVYSLKAAPWLVENFSVERYLGVLESLQSELERKGHLSFVSSRFLSPSRGWMAGTEPALRPRFARTGVARP